MLYSEHKIHPCRLYVGCMLVTFKNFHEFTIILCSIKIRKTLENTRLSRVLNVRLFARELSLAELRSTSRCFETVLRSFLSRFSLVFRAFPDFSLFSYPMW